MSREAQAAARLNHPGIFTLYEMGEEDGNALLVTELVDGSTLARLNRDGELSDREIGEIGADLCEALDHAHSRGVVHRDIKPQNVQITAGEPRAKLMDFGIARLADGASLTAPGDVLGTLAYMSPEQAEGRPAGPEADVYSLALTLYECWSGQNPHRRSSPAATARAIGTRTRPLRRLRPDLPRELSEAVDACLNPRPSSRPPLEVSAARSRVALNALAEDPRQGLRPIAMRLALPPPPRSVSGSLRSRDVLPLGSGPPALGERPPAPRSHRSASYASSSPGSKASSRGSSVAPSARRCSRSNWPANSPRKWTLTRRPRSSGSTSQ